jgi:hypothetical protein
LFESTAGAHVVEPLHCVLFAQIFAHTALVPTLTHAKPHLPFAKSPFVVSAAHPQSAWVVQSRVHTFSALQKPGALELDTPVHSV